MSDSRVQKTESLTLKRPFLSTQTRKPSLAEIRIISDNISQEEYDYLRKGKDVKGLNKIIHTQKSKTILKRAMSDPRIQMRRNTIHQALASKLRKIKTVFN